MAMNIEYNRFYVPDTEMMVCLLCGSAVRDTETHTKWHEDMYEAFSRVSKAINLTPAVCTDPDCPIPRKPGRPQHGPHSRIAGERRTQL